MKIVDDVAQLRQLYSGIRWTIHVVALVVWLFPYIVFGLRAWWVARFDTPRAQSLSMFEAVVRFVVSGGDGWDTGWRVRWWLLTAFVAALVYNVIRVVMLAKTKSLEMQEATTGVPANFYLRDHHGWAFWLKVAKWMFAVMILSVIVQTVHFLSIRVPVPWG